MTKAKAASTCHLDRLGDPAVEARSAIQRRDYRPITVSAMSPSSDRVSGVFCLSGAYGQFLESNGRVGAYYSDVIGPNGPASCVSVSEKEALTFNRTLASDPGFQKATGCRPSTFCEETYDKNPYATPERAKLDPRCPASPAIAGSIAAYGTISDLRTILKAGADPQQAMEPAVNKNRLDSVRLLASNGASVKESLYDAIGGATPGEDRAALIDFLLGNGADVNGGPCGAMGAVKTPLMMAVYVAREDLVHRLVSLGASPNGRYCPDELKRLADQPFQVALPATKSPFYAAISAAVRLRQPGPEGKAEASRYRRLAVFLLRSGGQLMGSAELEEWYGNPDTSVASILIAAARKAGRDDALVAYLSEGLRLRPEDEALRQQLKLPRREVVVSWLELMASCSLKVTVYEAERVRLCAKPEM